MIRLFKPLFLLTMCACVATLVHAQDPLLTITTDTTKKVKPTTNTIRVKPKGPKPIKNEVSFGLRLHTNGWSGYVDYGKVNAKNSKLSDMFHDVRFWQIEMTEKKSPRQEKIVGDRNATGSSSKYVYGKINNFYSLKAGYGIRKMIAGKPDPGSVSIHWSNVIGGALGMLKPYYLNVYSDPNAIRYNEDTKSEFLSQRLIIGSAGFSQGLGEMKFIPGGHFKSMLHFDFSTNRYSAMAIETGINIEYYSENLPIMADRESKPYFIDIFLAFQFGKRW
jgi:hypothetical protein